MKVYPIIAVLALLLAAAFPTLSNDANPQSPQPHQPIYRGGTTRR